MAIGALYNPPKPLYEHTLLISTIQNSVDSLSEECDLIILAGDYNALQPTEVTEVTGLVDIVNAPTRGTRTLDHVLVSVQCYSDIKVVDSVVNTGHKAIVAYTSNVVKNSLNKTSVKTNIRTKSPSINSVFLSHLLSIHSDPCSNPFFPPTDSVLSLKQLFDYFYQAANDLLNQFFPLRNVTVTSTDPSFVTPEIKMLLRRKNKLMRAGRVLEAESMAEKVRRLIIKSNVTTFHNTDPRGGVKELWDKVNHIRNKTNQAVPPACVTAHSLNQHYAQIPTDPLYSPPQYKLSALLNNTCQVTEMQVFNCLDRLKSTATGPDGLPSWFLRLAAPLISLPISILFTQSIVNSYVPHQWRTANILPHPKLTNPQTNSDYRPISITSVLSRTLERLVVKTYVYPSLIMPHPDLTFQDQYAFRPTGSTTAAIINLLQVVTAMLKDNSYVRVIALDFSKAFDTVRHVSLAEKLSSLDMPDCVHNWLLSFIANRSHYTTFQGEVSTSLTISAGVVQGSAVGPVAYTILASDLHPVNPCNIILKFADDTYLIIPQEAIHTTTEEIENIERWSKQNNLSLNRSKSQEILFHLPRRSIPQSLYPISLPYIATVQTLKCLGVTISSDLSIADHIATIITTCQQSLYAFRLLRSHGLSGKAMHTVFKTTTLAKLIYASPSWWGFANAQQKDRLESFLRKTIKADFSPHKFSINYGTL